tara:strand:+ start:54 stop:851 length:798 start_codon:yes stop_codon:yes gene_type:complete
MQRNRIIRKVLQDPTTVSSDSNIHRRHNTRTFTRSLEVKPVTHVKKSNVNIVNAESKPDPKVVYSTVPRKFEGETIYIIGGGPSLKNFDFRRLSGCKTIAINKSLFFHSQADAVYWTDTRFYTWYKNDIDNYKGLKFALKPGSQYTSDINILKKGKPYGIEEDPQTLAHGFNSGYAAINLAYHLGAKRIILLGFDMGNDGKFTHFHDGYPTRATGDRMYIDKFLPGFKQLKEELDNFNITILNASPYSKLTTFPKITIEQALSFR